MEETVEFRRGQIVTPFVESIKVINHRKCYIVTLENGRQYPITLMRFQLNEEMPARIRCLIKDVNHRTGDITIIQDLAPHLRRFYKIDRVYDFTVLRPTANALNKEYLVSDNYGFCFQLKTKDNQALYSHQHIRCRVKEISGIHLVLNLEGEHNTHTEKKGNNLYAQISDLIYKQSIITHLDKTSFVKLLFDNKGEFSFDEECTNWLLSLLTNKPDTVTQILNEIKIVSLYLLESSDILKSASNAERELLQERLSSSIDISDRFLEAMKIRGKEEEEDFIDALFEKLDKSGYIYQPQHKLGVLVTLFTLDMELMNNRMSELLRIIHKSPLEYWKQEPFRTAFIKLLEMYIRATREKADFSSTTSIENVEIIITALSIELCLVQTLADEQAKVLPCDLRLNRAMLYRYASYLSTQSPRALLESSFNNIMGVGVDKMLFSWEDTKNVEVVCNKLSTVDDKDDDENDYALTMQVYKGEHSMIRIGNGGIQIVPNIEDDDCVPVLPDDLLTWHQQQIFINGGITASAKKEDLNNYKKIWTEINTAINQEHVEAKPKKEPIKMFPDQGDIVDIRIDRIVEDNRSLMHCVIISEDAKGEGTMPLDSIVDWNPVVSEDAFFDDMGNQLCFEAKVVSVNAEGVCTFNMKELIKQHIYDSDDVHYNRKFIMLVKSVKGKGLNGVSQEGYPLNATIPNDVHDNVKVGDYVECVLDQEYKRNRGNISTTYLRQYGQCHWDESDAFVSLLRRYSYGTWRDKNADEKEAIELDSQLDRAYVHELMLLMDRQAAVESTIRSYSYLGMARTMAAIMGDEQSTQYYEWRMELLKMLDEFSINEVVDGQKLAEFEKLSPQTFQAGSQLKMRFNQLQIISYRDISAHNQELWKIASGDPDAGLRNLATLVLSNNMLKQFNLDHFQSEINAKIFELLNIKQRTSLRKNYGKESKTVEFKTSMVYPPENSMRPDLPKQTNTLLKVVCAFLNAEGGTLYVGVNNEGTAVGIDNDIAFRQFMYSPDKYDIYFHNAIKRFLGMEANSLVDTHVEDNEDGTSVYVVEVKPCPNVVELGGTVYQRQSTSCEPLSGEYLEAFRASRRHGTNVAETVEETQTETPVAATPKPVVKKKITQKTISTSQIRNNVLFNWDEDFEEPVAYIQFLPNAKYQIIDECFDDTETELTIAIHENEANGFLLLAYEDGHVVKVSLKEILEKEKYKQYQRCDSKLMFACPCFDNDLLFTVVKGGNGEYYYYRTDYISQMEKANITSEGSLLYSLLDYSILQADIVPNEDNIYMGTPGRAMGVSTVKGDGRMLKQKIEELGIEVCI